MAFFEWDHFKRGDFAGLGNFISVLGDKSFLDAAKLTRFSFWPPIGALMHNVMWIIIFVPTATLLGFIIASYLRDLKGGSLMKTILFFSYVLPLAVFGWMIFFIFDYNAGVLNGFLRLFMLERFATSFLTEPRTALFSLIFSSLYIWIGFSVVLYSAGLEQIPPELYDSAKIEGASTFQISRYICFPMLKPVTRMVLILATVFSLRMFDLVQVGTRGGPGSASLVLDVLVYRKIFLSSPSYLGEAGAIITISIILFLILTVAINKLVR